MRIRLNLSALITVAGYVTVGVFTATGQSADILTDSPNSYSGGGGASAVDLYSLDQIETVNSSSGTLNLSIPAAHLPPGPAGFSAAVRLIYNSALFDLQTVVPSNSQNYLEMDYVPSAHAGGWSYGYKYTLWSQTRVTIFNSATCSVVSQSEAKNWYKTILQTPDGGNHVLHLVGA